jgi:hypothetical protein
VPYPQADGALLLKVFRRLTKSLRNTFNILTAALRIRSVLNIYWPQKAMLLIEHILCGHYIGLTKP